MSWDFQAVLAVIAGLMSFVVLIISIVKVLKTNRTAYAASWRQIKLRNMWRIAGLLLGIALIVNGVVLYDFSTFGWDVLSGFLLVTGMQIVLFVSGIRLELLSNNLE